MKWKSQMGGKIFDTYPFYIDTIGIATINEATSRTIRVYRQ